MRLAWGALLVVSAAGVVLGCQDHTPISETSRLGEKLPFTIDDPQSCLETAAAAQRQAAAYFRADHATQDAVRLAQASAQIDLMAALCAQRIQEQDETKKAALQESIDTGGFDVLRLVSESRNERAEIRPADWDSDNPVLEAGSGLAISALTFMNVGTVAGSFVNELKTSGIFEVRGRMVDLQGATVGNDNAPATTHSKSLFKWGVEPQGATWTGDGTPEAGSTQVGMLIYGSPLANPQSHTTEALVDRNGGGIELGEAAYSFGSIPVQSFSPEIRVGTCWTDETSDLLPNAVLQRESGNSGLVVEYAGQPKFCSSTDALRVSLGSRLLRFAADLLATPLHAAAVNTGGTGGTKSSLSNWFLVHLGVIKADLEAGSQKDHIAVGDQLTLQIKVTAQEGTAVEKARVLFTIRSNNGQNATFCLRPCGDGVKDKEPEIQALTDESGVASIGDYGVAKPGGYKIHADVVYPYCAQKVVGICDDGEVPYQASFVTQSINVSQPK